MDICQDICDHWIFSSSCCMEEDSANENSVKSGKLSGSIQDIQCISERQPGGMATELCRSAWPMFVDFRIPFETEWK
ncbi:unnamed protein product [Caretta caretta]